ncbi:nucleobase:cation symporter-2 family protein [Rosenbergiella collisarenosi]|uniref:nucleobase:cation symporter-2 family protein n=1 Tax=Rosenbergiella collisarenosi TaxID=1544695 RepID=UPI001BDAC31E|nr:nucleobase:cation symporter-2 family protein [Rosenbergiella collisarenosi]MBT0722303.1 purine permease [Rosenbergiella collisarenosi]
MSKLNNESLLYGLNDRIPVIPAVFTAVQHMLASIVGIVTPPLIIGQALGLTQWLPYLISMSLFASGVGTVIQAVRFRNIGAGMICLQGTSFAFLGVIIAGGLLLKREGDSAEQILAMIFGCTVVAAIIPLIVSQFIHSFSRLLTPLVTGIVIVLIGISLIRVSITDWGGGFGAADFASPHNLGLGLFTLFIIVLMNCSRRPWCKLSSIVVGIVAGTLLASLLGKFHPHFSPDLLPILPSPFRFGISFSWTVFIPIALVSLISIIETVGDLTANCMLSQQPVVGAEFQKRIRAGILGDGVSCLVAAVFSSFPNTTFAQNNGVIQMTQVASRYAGIWIGGLFILLGLFPPVSQLLEQLPKPVLGGATLVMFGSVVAAGIRIMTRETLDSRGMLIIALSFSVGIGIESQPNFLSAMPQFFQTLFQNAVTSGGTLALLLNLLLPKTKENNDG